MSETSATLNGMATPNGLPTQAWFEWGTNTSYGQLTSPVDVGEGTAVVRVSTPITDALGRVIFVPAPDETGAPYASLSVVANDGDSDSAPGLITVNVLPQPVMEPGAFGLNESGTAFGLGFAGLSNATYSV